MNMRNNTGSAFGQTFAGTVRRAALYENEEIGFPGRMSCAAAKKGQIQGAA